MKKQVCKNCKYFEVCGDPQRTRECRGFESTKRTRKPMKRFIYSNADTWRMFEDAKKALIEELRKPGTSWTPSDEQVWEEVYQQDTFAFEDFSNEMREFISWGTFILQGTCGTWRGNFKGGFVCGSFNELSKAWRGCETIEVYDENGHLYIDCSHHDGSDSYEVRMLTEKGIAFMERNEGLMSDEDLHDKLMRSPYSVLPNYVWKMYGAKRREYNDGVK